MNIRVKLIILTLPAFLFTQCDRFCDDEIVEIPDQLFLEALIKNGVDTNGDNIISKTEAEAVYSLDIRKILPIHRTTIGLLLLQMK